MAAFNWIVCDYNCPKCGTFTSIKAQCHVASSFDGDERGRFCDRVYRLGAEMVWWPKSDSRWNNWTEGGRPEGDDSLHECCYAECTNCGTDLYAVIVFLPIKPVSIWEVGLEDDWPPKFKR